MKEFFSDELVSFCQRRWPLITKVIVSILMLWWTYFSMYTPTNVLNSDYKWLDRILPNPIWAAPAWFIWLAVDSYRRRKQNPWDGKRHWAQTLLYIVLAVVVGIPALSILLLLVACLFGMCISV